MFNKVGKFVALFSCILASVMGASKVSAVPITFDAVTTGTIELLGTTGAVSVSSEVFPPIFTDSTSSGPASSSTAGTMASEISGTQTAVASGSVTGGGGEAFAEALTSLTYTVLNTSDPFAPIAGSATFAFTYTLDIFATDPLGANEFANASSFVELNFRPATGASVDAPLFDGVTFFRDFIDTSSDGPDVTLTPPPFIFTIFVDAPGAASGFVTAVDAMGTAKVPNPGTLFLFGFSLLTLAVISRRNWQQNWAKN